jgi:hypothetical protein
LIAAAGLLTAGFAISVVACDDDDDGGDGTEATATSEPAGGEQPTEAPDAAEPTDAEGPTATSEDDGASGDVINLTMNEFAGSGVTGSATITPGDRIQIEVTIDGGLEEGSHESHIHQGACLASGGSVEFSLTNVEADGSGAGYASSTHFDGVLLAYLQDGDHYIAVHDHAGPMVTCGDIPTAS